MLFQLALDCSSSITLLIENKKLNHTVSHIQTNLIVIQIINIYACHVCTYCISIILQGFFFLHFFFSKTCCRPTLLFYFV